MRLIDADKLLDALPKDDTLLSMDVRRLILGQLGKDIVLCKDCVCMSRIPSCLEGFREDAGWCMMQGHVTLPDDFCSNGERMGEVNDKG